MEVDAAEQQLCMAPKDAFEHSKVVPSCSGRLSDEDQQAWTIPTAACALVSDSDVESVDVLRFDEPEGRASFLAGEPPPPAFVARNTAAVLAAFGATPVAAHVAPADVATEVIKCHGLDDTFYVFDLGLVGRLYEGWCKAMPSVRPFYAVKCNPDRAMLAMLAACGAGFDCASAAEIDLVLGLGVPADRIVYAHPCKPLSHIRHAAKVGVNLTSFDNESELHKLAKAHPTTRLLLRIRADDPHARCQLGNKYGAEISETARLLHTARALNLSVVGVSFHVGSGASSPSAFPNAITLARGVFDTATALGFNMTLLDLGGGFTGGRFAADGTLNLAPTAEAVNAALAQHFPSSCGVTVIAEPGRFFGEQPGALACIVNGLRKRFTPEGMQQNEYWVSDGLYGSLNCIFYDHATPLAMPLRNPNLPDTASAHDSSLISTTLWGPTCDGADIISRDAQLPQLRVGDFVFFPASGAYTIAGACNFNGFDVMGAKTFYYCSQV